MAASALKFMMRLAIEFEAPVVVSGGPLGTRRVLYARTGKFEGSGLRGEVHAGGGDWVLIRRDRSAQLDIRFTLRTEEGETIFLQGTRLFIASDSVSARIRAGSKVSLEEYYFRSPFLFETGSARLSHLNLVLYIGVGQRTAAGMTTDIFAVS
jgi:uncharacterized protein DUF3237